MDVVPDKRSYVRQVASAGASSSPDFISPLPPGVASARDAQQLRFRLALVDDEPDFHLLVREWLAPLADLDLAGCFVSGSEALREIPKLSLNLVLMDLNLKDMSGDDCTARLKLLLPALMIVVVTGTSEEGGLHSLASGARGYVLKTAGRDGVLTAIRAAQKGHSSLPVTMIDHFISVLRTSSKCRTAQPRLTQREIKIMRHFAEGKDAKEISILLDCSVNTIHAHQRNIHGKLGAHSVEEAVERFVYQTARNVFEQEG